VLRHFTQTPFKEGTRANKKAHTVQQQALAARNILEGPHIRGPHMQ
jgi:hypothetical protein